MSRGKNLQEMENAVTKGAAPAEPMQTMAGVSYEDLGGPTPEKNSPTDDSNKLKDPAGDGAYAANLKSVKGFMSKVKKEEVETEEEVVAEDQTSEEEVVTEEEVTEEEVTELPEITDEVDIDDDVNALLGGQELSEEFREKAKTIFEAALKSKVTELREAMESHYEAKLVEEVEGMKDELIERVDSYLEYVADEWLQENALQVERGLRTEMTETFLEGMRGLFEEHYVSIPEDKYDVVENMVDKLDEMESKLNEQIEKNITITKSLSEATADGIVSDVSEGLTTVQKEKLASLAEGVEFESEESYKEKLETLKESYFKTSPKRSDTEVLTEENAVAPVTNTNAMSAYIQALSHATKN
nr:scaffold prohead core protein [uncultured Mediterranean phage uvMED]